MDTMRERFTSVTSALLDTNPDIAVILAAIGTDRFAETGVIDRHPDRVIDVGIREQTMIGAAAGLALEGFRPIAHSYVPFLVERPYEQLKLDFGHQGVGAILVSVGASYDWAEGGRTHMAPGDVAVVSALPDWEVHVPGHPDEVESMLRSAAENDNRVYIRLSDRSNDTPHDARGRIEVLRFGTPTAPVVLAVGPMLAPVAEATADLDVTLGYAATVRPFDGAGLRAAAGGTDIVVVEPYLQGTSTPEVVAAVGDRPHRLLAIGVGHEELRRYGSPADHDRAWRLDAESLRSRIGDFIHRPRAGAITV